MANLYTEKKVRQLLKEQREICSKYGSTASSMSHFKDLVLTAPAPILPVAKLSLRFDFSEDEINRAFDKVYGSTTIEQERERDIIMTKGGFANGVK